MQSLKGEQAGVGQQELAGKAALIASVGGQRGYADWTNPDHRLRRLLAEFIGMAGLTFVLTGTLAKYKYLEHGAHWAILVLGVVMLLKRKHVDVAGDRAYVVIPVNYAYKQNGKAMKETGARFTLALHKSADGWRITGWAWSAPWRLKCSHLRPSVLDR